MTVGKNTANLKSFLFILVRYIGPEKLVHQELKIQDFLFSCPGRGLIGSKFSLEFLGEKSTEFELNYKLTHVHRCFFQAKVSVLALVYNSIQNLALTSSSSSG